MISCLVESEKVIRSGRVCDVMGDFKFFIQIHSQLPVWGYGQRAWSCLWQGAGCLSNFQERDGFLPGVVFTGVDGRSDCFRHLVMAPTVASVGQGCMAVAEEVLEGSSRSALRAGRCFTLHV